VPAYSTISSMTGPFVSCVKKCAEASADKSTVIELPIPENALVNEGTSAKPMSRPELRMPVGTVEAAAIVRKGVSERISVGGAWNVQPTSMC
jgi:hypothetical protein